MGGSMGSATGSSDGGFNETTAALSVLTGQKPMDPNGYSMMKSLAANALCKDCTVLAGKMDVVFETGTRADISGGVYLHHVIIIDLSKDEKGFVTNCPANENRSMRPQIRTFIGGAVVRKYLMLFDWNLPVDD
jgi:hypothetical protein